MAFGPADGQWRLFRGRARSGRRAEGGAAEASPAIEAALQRSAEKSSVPPCISPCPRYVGAMTTDFIALDWGTTSFRAYRVGANGQVQDTISAPEGILAVKDGKFEEALERHIGSWETKLPVMAAGMITSRQGWIELPYLPCPASAATLPARSTCTRRLPAGASPSPRASAIARPTACRT